VSLLCKYQQTATVVQAACARLQASAVDGTAADHALLRSSGVPQLLAAMYWHTSKVAVAADLVTTLYRIARTCSNDGERAEVASMCFHNRKYLDAALVTAQPSLPPKLVTALRTFMTPVSAGAVTGAGHNNGGGGAHRSTSHK